MKSKILIILFFSIVINSFSQNINWRNLTKEQKHIVNINIGLDYGTTIGIGYAYKLNTKLPIVLNTEFSIPFGNKVFDDFKTKIGAQAEIIKIGYFSTTLKAHGIFRKYENQMARFLNFGSEFSALAGIYKPKWFLSGELGFDKAITTHVKHSKLAQEYYPEIKNGWYVPSGGNFFYGLQSGFSFKKNDITLKFGKMIQEDFKTNSTIPFYLQLGLNRKL